MRRVGESAEVEDDVVGDEEERSERTRLRMWWKGCLESRMRLSAGDIEVVEVDVAVVDAGSRRCGRTGMAGGRAADSRIGGCRCGNPVMQLSTVL